MFVRLFVMLFAFSVMAGGVMFVANSMQRRTIAILASKVSIAFLVGALIVLVIFLIDQS